ncbi:MAG: hypothetical protein F4Y67_07670 [Chloroflexi bacterium]|nr:hypothetical protein [Chloroflexota bacterium]
MFGEPLSSNASDLLEVVLAIYAADRDSLRDFSGERTGHRRFNLRIGLKSPRLWQSSTVQDALLQLVNWVSGDDWAFEFVDIASQKKASLEPCLFNLPLERPLSVSLFSGGLDSLAGLADQMQRDEAGGRVLVSIHTNNRLAAQQRLQVKRLRQSLDAKSLGSGSKIWHASIRAGKRKHEGQREEKSQRLRALLFLAVGAIAAVMAKTGELWVYENGVGALNLPLDATQLGVDNYRGVHPRSLMLFERLTDCVFPSGIRAINPFLFKTKAEMCEALPSSGFADVVKDTVSCDSFPLRISGVAPQCGYCTSCVLRRQSLSASGLGGLDDPSSYRYDVLGDRIDSKQRKHGLEVMQWQAFRIAAGLSSSNPWRELCAEFPELARTSVEIANRHSWEHGFVASQLIGLYRRYSGEWQRHSSLTC